jgi:hypothetical protein
MNSQVSDLAQGVLAAHVAVILFNVFGLVAVPLGARFGWRFVRVRWWRALHLASWAVVALQALFGRACFLTLWQDVLQQGSASAASQHPLIQRWVEYLIYWPLPLWLFSAIYLPAFGYAILLWRLVPPEPRRWARRQAS